MSNTKCNPFEHPRFMGTWWSCCQCKTLNGDARNECKHCSHSRCDNPVSKTITVKQKDGSILVGKVAVPKLDIGKMN